MSWDSFYIELYENYNCNSKEELNRREGEVIREIGTLNKVIAGRTPHEYYKDNFEKKKEYEKQYMSVPENRAKRNEYQKERMRNAYYKNKETIQQQQSVQYTCACGCIIRTGEKSRHKKSETHKYFVEHNEQKPKIGVEGSRELQKQKITCECGSVCGKGDLSKHLRTKKHLDYIQNNQN
jgi:hypothetical protein